MNLDDEVKQGKALIVAGAFALLGVGFLLGVILTRWIG